MTFPETPIPVTGGAARRELLLPHLVWEGVLLLGMVLALILGAARWHVLRGPGLTANIAVLVLLGGALALSLRTATPNLAVGVIASGASLMYLNGLRDGRSTVVAILVVLAVAVLVGLVMAVLTGLLGLPGWAVSLAAMALVLTFLISSGGTGTALPRGSQPWGDGTLTVIAVLAGIGSVGLGLASRAPGVRRVLGANRPGAAPAGAVPAGLVARLVGALVGMVGSTVLAAVAGIVLAGYLGFASGGDDGLLRLLPALAVALLGGAGALGGRGGIAGTVIAAVLLAVVGRIIDIAIGSLWARTFVIALAVVLGLLVSAGFEGINRLAGRSSVGLAGQGPGVG